MTSTLGSFIRRGLARLALLFIKARGAILLLTISVLVCGLPLLLLLDLRSVFDFDWFNHLWTIEYFGEYLRQHGMPPAVLSTENLIGIVSPIFYAEKFYSFTGVISSFLGSAIAFRIVAFASLMIQFWHVERAVRHANGDRFVSMIVGTVVTWAIYSVTNLYNRSALTEFIAGIFLNSAISSLFVLLLRHSRGQKSYYDAVAMGFLYAIAALTHPLTAAFGAAFLICMGACFLFCTNRTWFACVCLINAILVTGVLSPWLHVLYRYSAWLPINDSSVNQEYFRGLLFHTDGLNNLWSLLSPVALDLRTLQNGIKNVSTPFLDAQINLPLIVIGLTLGCAWITSEGGRSEKSRSTRLGVMIVSVFLFGLFLSVASHPSLSGYLGGVFDILQFPYRLTTYINLAALTFLLASAGLGRNVNSSPRQNDFLKEAMVLGVSLGMSFSGLISKLIHADATRVVDPYADLARLAELHGLPKMPDPRRRWVPANGRSSAMLGILPTTFYSHSQYTVLEGYSLVQPTGFNEVRTLQFLPGTGKEFGDVAPANIVLQNATLVITNIQPFPWNQIFVNERQKKSGDLVVLAPYWVSARGRPGVLAVPLTPGEYTIEYRFRPDKVWRPLEFISTGIIVIWFIVWIAVATFGAKDRMTKRQEG